MNLDNILMIPHLSKELNLIGHTTLPYNLVKRYSKLSFNDGEDLKIVFDSKKMIETLTSVCFELVKQVKALGFIPDDNKLDKLSFENSKLEKQLKASKAEIDKKISELANEKRNVQLLKTNIEKLEKQVKGLEGNIKKLTQKNFTSENILKHSLKKKESDLIEMHKLVWKQFNMVDYSFFPENFKIIQLEQPNFNKLWSEVKYSSIKNREEALKKAVCIFQENNKILMEDNLLFKNLLLITLQEINEVTEIMQEKLHLYKTSFGKSKVLEIFKKIEKMNVPVYKNFLNEHFSTLRKICEFFEEASFSVSNDLFVCWSDILKKLKLYETPDCNEMY